MKLLAYIELPYFIALDSNKEFEINLWSDETFSSYTIKFLIPDIQTDLEIYTTKNLKILATFKNIDNTKIYKEYSPIYQNKFIVDEKSQKKLFNEVRIKLNKYLLQLNKKTNMYWIQPLSLNHLNGCIGVTTSFVFIEDNQVVSDSITELKIINNSIMKSEHLKSCTLINEHIAKSIEYITEDYENGEFLLYEDKAHLAITQYQFQESIIYMAISLETAMKFITNQYKLYFLKDDKGLEKDVILEHLISRGKNQFLDTYLNLIFSYIFHSPMKEKYPKLYKNLQNILKLRNAIMHSGSVTQTDFKNIGEPDMQELTYEFCYELFQQLQIALDTIFDDFVFLAKKLDDKTKKKENKISQ